MESLRTMGKYLCIPTCWEDDYLDQLVEQGIGEKLHELYGSLSESVIGSGRASFTLPQVSLEQAGNHIQKIHSMGIKFDYLLNAACMGNMEFAAEGQKKLLSLLHWLQECEVETVTVSIPYLVEVIKRYFPEIAVNISTIAHVDSVPKAKFWEALGADRITLDFMMNRDFEFLRSVRSAVNCKLEVIMHDLCIYGCPYRYYHFNTVAHASQESSESSNLKHKLAVSYPTLKCILIKLTDFSEIMKIRWIRPEDIVIYRDLGIDFFKVVGRTRPAWEILTWAKAYADGAYQGNLLDIMPIVPAGMEGASSIADVVPIYVDNQKLDGFLDYFQSSQCRTDCHECSYCREVAEKAVKVTDKEQLNEFIAYFTRAADSATNWESII